MKIVILFILIIYLQYCLSCENDQTCSATYYTTPDTGACGYLDLYSETGPKTDKIVALSTKFFQGSKSCGACFLVYQNITDQPVRVVVTDECPADRNQEHCAGENAHFDLSQSAFKDLAELSVGVLKGLQYQMVPCNTNGNIKIKTKDGSNDNWAAFMVFNHKVPVDSLSIRVDPSTDFIPLDRKPYNYFPASFNLAGTYTLKITSIFGESILVNMKGVVAYQITDSKAQFSQLDGCMTNPPLTGESTTSNQPPVSSSVKLISSFNVILLSIFSIFLILNL